MSRLREIFAFELRYHVSSPLFWVVGVLFFFLSFGAVTTDTVQIGGAIGNVNRNAPFVIMQFLLVMSVVGVFVTTAFVASAVVRDYQHGTAGLFFTTPTEKRDYLLGRFAGAITVSLLIFLWVVLAVAVGGAMPWLEPERVGPFMPGAYAYSFAFLVLPNVLVTGAVFFALATWSRSMAATYAGVVAFFVAYAIAQALLSDVENEQIVALVDPFAIGAFQVATQYWTTAERNARVLGLDPTLLQNRALWVGVGALVFGLTYWRFSFTEKEKARRRGEKERADAAAEEREDLEALVPTDAGTLRAAGATRSFGPGPASVQLLRHAWFEVRRVGTSLPFLVILALAALNLTGAATATDSLYGTPVWPRTRLMLQVIGGSFLLFGVIILAFYSGDLVWRDREGGTAGVIDALPPPHWVYWGAKVLALAIIVLCILAVAVAAAMANQLFRGFTELQPLLYVRGLGLRMGPFLLLLAVLALAGQVLTDNKYAGWGVMAAYFVALPVLDALHLEHHLYIFAGAPSAPYSDLNGYGHFVEPVLWFTAYWGFFAVGLLVLVHLFWVRGEEARWRIRLREARRRWWGGARATAALAMAGFVGSGAWIFYNTNVRNDYVPTDVVEDRQAQYERRYGVHQDAPQPKIVAVYAEVDLFPYRRALDARGSYTVVNKHEMPLDSLFLNWNAGDVDSLVVEVPGASVIHDDPVLGWRAYALERPLSPGDSVELGWEVRVRNPGFVNHGTNTDLVYNGTFVNNARYLPHIGYSDGFELTDPVERRRHGLPEVERMAPLDDSTHYDDNYLTSESDWVEFETVVSTAGDQLALAPGYLQREWTENGRRYFHYRMDAPILGFWSYLSGKWEVERDRWNDVEIAVYHHPDHTYNVDRMIESVKASLDYFTENFGPYQHRQVRIIEFPRYATFAQSFPNTIPFSESIGFIARLADPKEIDYPFYVTAHEVAHQWWAHQVIGADVQGATMTSETMAQYSALMVQEQRYGPEKMRRFLRYELDQYLQGRGGELIEELPLYRVENQGYIHYRKGSLATYALRDLIGEEAFNRAMARYVDAVRFRGPPYTTSAELLSYLEEAVPPEHRAAVEDLFRTITLWELEATDASAEPTGDGRWRVGLEYTARKVRADGQGNETDVAMDQPVDVAVFGAEDEETPEDGKVLLLEQRRISGGPGEFTGTLELVVDEEPVRAGIDPFNKLIDRNPGNNVAGVGGG